MSEKKIDRRRFIKGAAAAGAGVALGALAHMKWSLAELASGDSGAIDRAIRDHKQGLVGDADAQATVERYMTGSSGMPKVIHVHDPDATSWDFATGWYGHYVNQTTVNSMVDQGLMVLTGQSTVASAWQALLPGYSSGKAIAIKVNFNNTDSGCGDPDNQIDALIEPVNGLIRGMKLMGVQEQDIWIYDASRGIPDSFRNGCPYANVRFFDRRGCAEPATFASSDPDASVNFGHSSISDRRITDVIIDATYLINIPIIKDHGIAAVSLGFKNHFGTINDVVRGGGDDLHYYINPFDSHYSTEFDPQVDIYLNPHIRYKTVLVVGDALFGAFGAKATPTRWSSFGNDAPNSLFFSSDPVAADCVMFDILDAEPVFHPRGDFCDNYLVLASSAGLGVFERGDPWGSGYLSIDYHRIEL